MIINNDCLFVMSNIEANSVDFIVTDPPYGLHFMGKHWDGRIPSTEIWAEALRICKPGAMLAAFGGSRTHHHLMYAIEEGGWEIRDVIMWIYGSGFPKSHNFGRQMGREWKGYGTALKPAYEPIIIAMNPLDGTFKENAKKWGVGGINIDECRIGISGDTKRSSESEYPKNKDGSEDRSQNSAITGHSILELHKGRWPANVIFDEEATKTLDEMSGILKTGSMNPQLHKKKNSVYSKWKQASPNSQESSSGGASRFFYCAKASSKERNAGLEGMSLKDSVYSADAKNGQGLSVSDSKIPRQNNHPTVKPIALMKYIIKLIAPPGNPTLLDPFCGSGSTLLAAKELGINAIGIEKEEEYCQIASRRLQ